jgi:hypothetical protein
MRRKRRIKMNWLNQLLCSHKFYFRVRDEITNKNKWQCQTCGKRFHYLDNTDLPVPKLTAPRNELIDYLVQAQLLRAKMLQIPLPHIGGVTPPYPHIPGNQLSENWPNLRVVTKKNLTPTEPTIYDTVMEMVERGL